MARKKYSYKKLYKDINEITEKRFNVLISTIIVIMFILISYLFYVQILKFDVYTAKVSEITQNVIYGTTAPRGRIYDRNGRIIVDNIAVKVIYYKKPNNIKIEDEIFLANRLSELLEVNFSKITNDNIKKFWIDNNQKEAKTKIKEEEWKLLEERKITLEDIEKYKLERVSEKEMKTVDPETAYIYYLMNKGYYYSEKVIKSGAELTDLEYATVGENISNLKGVNTKLNWERYYPYGDVFKTILGTVSSTSTGIPYELKEYYLDKGYSLNDQVGTSYLEYQYDDYLKGTKNIYEITNDGSYRLIEEGKRGNDLVISIDIELQKSIEAILKDELMRTKNEANTKYYNKSFVIINDPKTGDILTMAGKQIIKKDGKYEIYDYTPGIVTSPIVPGSVIKGASHIVGYNSGALKIGERREDACIKIAATPIKCSVYYMGIVNDVDALAHSSNTYQFNTAIKVGNGNYKYNQPLKIDTKAFEIYRNTFAEFGLGVKTGIDLPVESLGYKGVSKLPGYLLDFAIGQYDTYTPIQLSQYVSTIANNGIRIKPKLLKTVYSSNSEEALTNRIYENKAVIINTLNTKSEYLKRVRMGFQSVIAYGTGYGYIDSYNLAAGKTGTSESFIDTDNDGIVDTETISNAFVAYAPYNNPKVAFTVVSPDVAPAGVSYSYRSNVNKRITQRITKKYFQMYK